MGATQCQGMADAGSGAARLAKAFARRLSGVVNGRYYFIRPAWYDESTGEEPKEILRKLSLAPFENLTATRRRLALIAKLWQGVLKLAQYAWKQHTCFSVHLQNSKQNEMYNVIPFKFIITIIYNKTNQKCGTKLHGSRLTAHFFNRNRRSKPRLLFRWQFMTFVLLGYLKRLLIQYALLTRAAKLDLGLHSLL